tara:strand:- start:823 stop:1299 length:477 start_codon:yes stop_codon:yes gene_type:complete
MAYDPDYQPAQPNAYQGKQIILNSDRILFNAKNDSVLVYADKSINLNSQGTMNFDNEGLFVVNSNNEIYLGLKGKKGDKKPPTEPALLGDKTGIYLQDMLNLIQDLVLFLAAEYKVTVPLLGLSAPGPNDISSFLTTIQTLKSEGRLKDIKSKKVKLV